MRGDSRRGYPLTVGLVSGTCRSMRKLRISGLVGLAKRVRQELAGPVSPERLAQIRWDVQDAVQAIEQFLRDKSVRAQDLPAPSRKAFQFLQGLDLDSVVTEESASASRFPPESVSFRGLLRYFDGLLNELARAARECSPAVPGWDRRSPLTVGVRDPGPQVHDSALGSPTKRNASRSGTLVHGQASPRPLKEVYETIRTDSENIEQEIRAQHLRPEQLKKPARQMRGWFAYFAQREHFDEYCAAVRRAEPIFHAASRWAAQESFEMLIHFRPLQGMYHIVGYSNGALVQLPTPAISFNDEVLRSLARTAFKRGGDRKTVHEAVGGAAYQKIVRALEKLSGVVTQARGVHHDLDASFDRVNAAYFGGAMSRPHLVWSRTFATRKFGHYDHAHDTVMVNMVLDRPTVPDFVVDLIMYHELLHKLLGVTWKNNRVAAHTPELAARERRFQHYDQAKAILRKLASER
jgi:hypothetical protein